VKLDWGADGVANDVDTAAGKALPVQLRNSGGAEIGTSGAPVRTDPTGTTTQPVSAASLPLPTGAAQDSSVQALVSGTDFDAKVGSLTETAPATDTASSGLNGRLQRIAQRLTSLIALLPTALGAGGGLKVDGSGTALPVSGTVTANAGTNLNTSALALETGGNLATIAGAVSSSKMATKAASGDFVDGALATIGVKADAKNSATDTTAVSAISIWKQVSFSAQAIATSLAGTLTVASHAVTNAGTFAVQATEADGANTTLGSKADAKNSATDTTAITAMSVWKQISASVQAIATSIAGTLTVATHAVTQSGTWNIGTITTLPAIPAGTNNIGFVTLTPSTTGGWSPSSQTALSNTKTSVKASAGTLGGYMFYNPNSSVVYIQVFDVASGSVTVGSTTPTYVIPIPATSGANVEFTNGINHATAIVIAATTTATNSTAPSTALTGFFLYK
jgi:hypothetical protein